MRKWQDLAAPDDPGSWADVSNMWGTGRGTYETSDIYGSSANITAVGEGNALACWAFNGLSAVRAYYIGDKIWQLDLSALTATDRTGGITVGTGNMMAQYGDITILTRGTSNSLASSSGGNFSALAGSPSAKFVVVQSNCVLAFNTSVSADGWAASDVGDYTNWSTGEAASGRILENNGPITGAVAYGNDVYVFKADSIFRMSYVGGVVKWQVQKVVQGIGCVDNLSPRLGGNQAVATNQGIFFCGQTRISSSPGQFAWYLFDGASQPVLLNPLSSITSGVPTYDAVWNRAVVWYVTGTSIAFRSFSFDDGAWGNHSSVSVGGAAGDTLPLRGDHSATGMSGSSYPTSFRPLFSTNGSGISYKVPKDPATVAGSSYLQTTKMGSSVGKTTFKRLTPQLRRRTNYSSGTPVAALGVEMFRERHDTTTASTQSVTESNQRKRFDFLAADNFGRFKVTFTDMDVEVDDFAIDAKSSGTD